MIIYLNGSYLSSDQARISPNDRGFLLGDGVFETLYVDRGHIECLDAHMTLLTQGASLFRIPYGDNSQTLKRIITQLIHRNGLQEQTAAVRVTVSRGEGSRGVLPSLEGQPTLLVTAVRYQRSQDPWSLTISLDRLTTSRLSSVKHLGYQESILARLEAQEAGYDDALFFNQKDELVRSTVANVFVYQKGEWLTPPVHSGARPGVMRGRILQKGLARVQKISLKEVTENRQGIVLTNSLMGVQPVEMLNSKSLDLTHALALRAKLLA